MKKLLAALLVLGLLALCGCGQTTVPRETTAEKSEAFESAVDFMPNEFAAYSGIIDKLHEDLANNESLYAFVLYDIDSNGVKELLLGKDPGNGSIGFFTVYANQNGVAVQQEPIEFWRSSYSSPPQLFKDGTIRTGGENFEGFLSYSYYRFEDGVLQCQARIIDESKGLQAWLAAGRDASDFTGDLYVRINPKDETDRVPMTKEEFMHVQQEFEGDGQVVALNWKSLAEYGGNP